MTKGLTPIRRQYLRIKEQYPETIVFFRLGDFYETFEDDAEIVARELQIVLTSRSMGKGQRFPMAGIPHHALEGYLAKLITAGHKVAICEQTGDPKTSKGLVERDVVRVVTPGTVVETNLLESTSNNYLAAVVSDGEKAGIAYVDITTSEFATTQISADRAVAELERLNPSEILVPKEHDLSQLPLPPTTLDDRWFAEETAQRKLTEHFGVASLEGYGCAGLPLAIRAAGAIIHYLEETQKGALGQLPKLSTYSVEAFMVLDTQTRRNLELFRSGHMGTGSSSLLWVIDLTKTPMGGRLIKKWLGQPLLDIDSINRRQEAVAWLVENTARRIDLINSLSKLADMERLINRVRSGIAIAREIVSLRHGLEAVPQIKAVIDDESSPLGWLSAELKPCPQVVDLISQAIVDEASAYGELIKPGFSPELDQIRSASRNAKQYLADLESREKERTGIKSLKVGYNKVFGYYIEVTSAHLDKVPEDFIRKQTLVGAERFFTPELKEYESLILNADERISELENTLFRQVCQQISGWGERILMTAQAIARIDILAAFAEVAVRYSYVRPELTTDDSIRITGGRHPVVEQVLTEGGFVPNETYLSNGESQVIILTGPNMAGKSTYLRQVALIVLMAQIGSFVPAESATIGLVDRIFTRVGLMDDLATGRSTFMIEMTETANILNNATPKSLIILDEIGRGTSTYDGKIVPGGADRSYGIHVAQLAGLPRSVVHRAEEILEGLENGTGEKGKHRQRKKEIPASSQIPLFGSTPPVVEELQNMEIDSMTPLEAITRLYELQKKARS